MKTIKKQTIILGLALLIIVVALYSLTQDSSSPKDYKNTTYQIDGKDITLVNGVSEVAIPNSSAMIVTRYFGNELVTDLDGDGDQDVAFIMTQETGGSGVFFYAVAALKGQKGYESIGGYFLGDRIAPQPTTVSQNSRHKNVVVFNYADRKVGEPMSATPSIGKSVYLKVDATNKAWGIVEPNFEGEAR